jgi:Transposase DDE domain group 1
MDETTPLLPGLSPVGGKAVAARFDGGALSSDAGLLGLREVERRLDLGGRLAACIEDPRDPTRTQHSVADILRFRMLMIAAGYEDGIDANALRTDPVFKMALERLPGERDLCSQSTVSRLENLPDRRMLLKMGRAMVGLYCASFAQVPKRIVLDIDDTFDAVHGAQQLRRFNAHYDEYGFQPIVVFDGAGRFVTAVLRPAKRPKGREIAAHLRRLIRVIREHWPRVEILLRGDGHYCAPEVLDLCRAQRVDFILGLPTTSVLRRHVAALETSTGARAAAAEGGTVRRFKAFHDAAASWSRVERIVARVEAGPRGCDTRFVVTSLTKGTGKAIYERLYCARGQAENHIKAWKAHLAADRTSCTSAAANQLRLFLHAGAYWMMWTLRAALPRRSPWRRVQFDTLRLRLIKIAARVVEMKTRITVHLPSACPAAPIMRMLLERLPRMAPI